MECYSWDGRLSRAVIRCFFSWFYEDTLIPGPRVRVVADAPVAPGGDFILYWMTASRRLSWNFALDRALEHARELRVPVVILEALLSARALVGEIE